MPNSKPTCVLVTVEKGRVSHLSEQTDKHGENEVLNETECDGPVSLVKEWYPYGLAKEDLVEGTFVVMGVSYSDMLRRVRTKG